MWSAAASASDSDKSPTSSLTRHTCSKGSSQSNSNVTSARPGNILTFPERFSFLGEVEIVIGSADPENAASILAICSGRKSSRCLLHKIHLRSILMSSSIVFVILFGGFAVHGFRDQDPVLGDLGTGVGFDCPADLDRSLSR